MIAWRSPAVDFTANGWGGLHMLRSNEEHPVAQFICILYALVVVIVCDSCAFVMAFACEALYFLLSATLRSTESIMVLLYPFICLCLRMVCRRKYVSTPRIQHTCRKNVGVLKCPLSTKSFQGVPYTNIQLFASASATMLADMLECRTVLTCLEIRSVITSRHLLPRFKMSGWPWISAATNYSSAVAGNSFM